MVFFRLRISRPLKVIVVLAFLFHVGVVLFSLSFRIRGNPRPWLDPGSDEIGPWKHLIGRAPTMSVKSGRGNGSATTLETGRHIRTTVVKQEEKARHKTEKPQQPNAKISVPTTCPKTVASLTRYSKWFRERYQPDIKLFLDKDDIKNYSKYLTRGLPFGFKRQNLTVLKKTLQHPNFINPSVHGPGGRKGCIRCAVVGCGGILNGSGAGKEIDGHDYIFRLNRAISSGNYARDVGIRTTFYTFFPESQHIRDVQDKSALMFFAMFKAYDVNYALSLVQEENSPKYLSRGKTYGKEPLVVRAKTVKIVHPALFDYVSQHFLKGKARPTTGSIVVFLALHVCDEVTIYGFGYDPRYTLHYYDTKFVKHTNKSTVTHDVKNERLIWTKLHEEGAIRLFKRDL